MAEDTQDVVTKKRYRTRRVLNIGDVGTFNRGELIDEEQVPKAILDELAAADNSALEYVDTVQWNPTGHGGQGAWEAIMAPIEDPTPAPTAKDKQPAGPSGPATKPTATNTQPSTSSATDGAAQGGTPATSGSQ